MLYLGHKLLAENTCNDLRKRLLMSNDWSDGSLTASGMAQKNKRNLQIQCGESYDIFSEEIVKAIKEDELVNSYAFPAKVFSILFSRTGVGMYYKPHLDLIYNKEGRRDLSFTIFLNKPDEYKGGELILYIRPEKKSIKLRAGEMIIYPTKYLHEVKEVTEGERIVCVGWIESQIARDDDRDTLSLLQKGMTDIAATHGNIPSLQTLNMVYNHIYKRFIN